MGELLRRGAMMGAVAVSEPAPLFSLDGTYTQTSNGTTTITIVGSHCRVEHKSSSGNGNTGYLKVLTPADFYNVDRAWRVEITNYTKVSGDPTGGNAPGQGIRFGYRSGVAGADAARACYTLWLFKDGNGIYEKVTNNSSDAANRANLWISLPYHAAYTIEFDFKIFVDDVWYF